MAKQLLVVDDDPGLLLAVSETLRAEGYDVQTARRGGEAMVRVAEALPDLIISDIRMPEWMATRWCVIYARRRAADSSLLSSSLPKMRPQTASRISHWCGCLRDKAFRARGIGGYRQEHPRASTTNTFGPRADVWRAGVRRLRFDTR